MTITRWWTAGAVLVMALLVALGWILGMEPQLAEARAADEERVGVETLNATYEQTLVKLKELDEDLPALTQQLDELEAALPPDAQVSTLLGQLNALAAESAVELTSITAGVPEKFGAAAEAAAALAPVEAPAPEESDDTAAVAPDTETVAPDTETAAPAPENFVAVPISVEFTGDPVALLAFVEKVQYGTRLFLVEALDITYDGGGGKVKIDGFVYVLTDPPAADETAPAEGD
ncbi:Tfp pilus assembly protein PilO [Marisediminicola sp. UYEF4]|uniref:type 4a pilus biogenesis protein PilO n=1 Tax=Marisediminicola sp. UYEF4 TaxID=1756384 RepID=UPI003394A27B